MKNSEKIINIKKRGAAVTKKFKLSSTAKKIIIATYLSVAAIIVPTMALAASDGGAAKWETIINFILPWIARLGGVVTLIGGVEFGLAWKNDDAEAKTKGMRTIIAGLIVIAVGAASDVFLMK
ncbi:MAG: hypothetical protein RR540_00140 [Oscillospiraceae bacterium]